ncbi:FimV/HubP family polar landmark protein [Dechloromonas sp. TW-R-39-2]|uniref:FimV/HubP family polar landmark protein n=1 Tax=Dechloromonas sp. TW-R-39-2 TaxID=2654218 RepID=UPI00193D992A|nr:FimV/HubP family polar landmark protein [Dechloromonas sp. TW-R-39-2]
MTVLSGLGQPLRAELEVAANREELVGMTARLAPQSAFRQAGVDYSSVLNDLRFNVEKRPDGKSVVKVTSEKPINEPFLDFLMELNWPAGRLVREYTFLLDPPEIAAKQVARPVAEARVVETVRGGGAQVERTERAERPPEVAERPKVSKPASRPVVEEKPQPAPEKKATEPADGRVVRSGDTLHKIAAETRVEGVSLDQMLVGIFQKNPDAFIGNNMNRLKAGAILGLPEKTELESLSDADVKKVLVAQSGDWNAYRQKLASATAKAPAKEESLGQGSSGKIAAKVDEKALPSEQAKDQVKVSRTEMPVKGSAASKSVLGTEADLIARDRSLKEAQERLAFLEKNVGELQKLLEMKNQKLAELQQQGAVKKEESKPLEPAKVVEPPKPVEPAKVVEPPKEAAEAKPAEPSKPVEVKPAAEVPKPAAAKKPEAVKPPEPEEELEPGFIETLLADPLPLAGGGGILALLAGYLLFKRRRDHNASVETTAAPVSPSSGGNSVFRMTGGQSVDTSNTPPQTGDFSQAGPGSIDTDEVDPVAEADVYMAYGRDAQAEEILLEALQKDPNRIAIHAKLLEIYANRKSVKQFETLASELYAQTAGVGPEWAKVAALGVGLDPGNPLYSGVQRQASAFNADATMVVTPEVARQAAQFMPDDTPAEAAPPAIESVDTFERDTLVLPEVEPAEPEVAVAEVADEVMSLDFDLGAPADEMSSAPAEDIDLPAPPAVESLADASDALDFDLGASIPAQPALQDDVLRVDDSPVADDLDFELDIAESSAVDDASEPLPDFSPGGTLVMPALGELAGSPESELSPAASPVVEPEPEAPLGDFSLDLDTPPANAAPAESYGTDTVVNTMLLDQAVDIQNPSLTDATADENAVEFDVKLTDSVFLGQPATPEFDIGAINLDLSAEPAESAPAESTTAPVAAASSDNAQWEEVNTKLDLAKAYEEMGDLEGARELLQEVASEGPVDLVEQAREILARIGG